MLETVYVNEAVLLRTLDIIKELAAAKCWKSENTCKMLVNCPVTQKFMDDQLAHKLGDALLCSS
jgi:hypothetical protein